MYVLADNGLAFRDGGRVGAVGATGWLTLCNADKMPPFGNFWLPCTLPVCCKTDLAALPLFVTPCFMNAVADISLPLAGCESEKKRVLE